MITINPNNLAPNSRISAAMGVSRKQINKYNVKSMLIKREFRGKGYSGNL
jgi:hypothetical protein